LWLRCLVLGLRGMLGTRELHAARVGVDQWKRSNPFRPANSGLEWKMVAVSEPEISSYGSKKSLIFIRCRWGFDNFENELQAQEIIIVEDRQ